MSRISKETATRIALKLTEKTKAVVDELKKEYQELVTSLYEAQTPLEVKEAFKKHPDWFYTRSTISFSGHGFQWETVTGPRQIICNGGTSANLQLNDKIADQLTKAKRKFEKADKEYKDLKTETESALLSLKTYSQIKEHLPEAAPLLPIPMSNALVVNFDSLKKRLERQPKQQTLKQ